MTPARYVRSGGVAVELGGGGAVDSIPVEIYWPSIPYCSNLGSGGAAPALNAAGEFIGWAFQAPKDGVIDRCRFNVTSLGTNPTVLDVRLETIAATGLPSGTLIATGANGTATITSSNANIEITFGTPPTVQQGDWIYLKLLFTSGNVSVVREPNAGIPSTYGGTYGAQNIDTVTGRFHNKPFPFGIRYNDGNYARIDGTVIAYGTITNNYMSTTNPDERGIKMTMPFSCKAHGMWFSKGTSIGTRTLKLYDSANTVLWSNAWDADFQSGTSPIVFLRFDSDFDLVAGDIYRLTCLATEAVNIQINEITAPTGLGYTLPGRGVEVEWTQRNDGGSWAETADKTAAMGLLLSEITVPA